MRSRTEIVADNDRLMAGSRCEISSEILRQLHSNTAELIGLFGREKLLVSPFSVISERSLEFDMHAALSKLEARRILVTGAMGCVGSALIKKLRALSPGSKLILTDMAGDWDECVQLDVTDRESVNSVFSRYRPEIVFHLAAQRLPHLAEKDPFATVNTNLIGTWNMFEASREYDVTDFVFSSSGKASRYVTKEVYAGTKKLCEWLLSTAADSRGGTRVGIARFTHIIENSNVVSELTSRARSGIMAMNSSDKFFSAQNVSEAVSLLIQALCRADYEPQVPVVVSSDVGLPVDALQLGLHILVSINPSAVVYFRGRPPGYQEKLFFGQYDVQGNTRQNPMTNLTETTGKWHGADMLEVNLPRIPSDLVVDCFNRLGMMVRLGAEESTIRDELSLGLFKCARESFDHSPVRRIIDVFRYGADTRLQSAEDLRQHTDLLVTLKDSFAQRMSASDVDYGNSSEPTLQAALDWIDGQRT